ncbi:hypothetical protein K2173_003896 [Erythroxylum novogranatense]|uniref:Kinesin motor domain-containing protein n=1 Tax=Erythroxylum novogranatense TaxID=1862640 RepID=A0AAV8SJ57_9ROSI|nr:hypothetical protein K2173_003896 [Erythroxylum novogranatense]
MVPISDRKVRVVAKFRGSLAKEVESSKEGSVSWLSVYKPKGEDSETGRVEITLIVFVCCSRRECYEVDFCYEQNQGNDAIYSREVKPLISRVFEGHNATVIACGARGSGKSYMIQVRVASMAEFQKSYCADRGGMRKLDQKIVAELPSRSHKELIIYILSCGEEGNDVVVGKMNFVDLAGTILVHHLHS